MGKITNYVSFGIFVVALLFFILAFATPWWVDGGLVSSGLFMSCGRLTTSRKWQCGDFKLSDTGAKHKATVSMMIMSLFAQVVALVLYIMTIAKDFSVRLGAIVCGIGGLLTMIAVSVYGSQFSGTSAIGWSFALACTSCVFEIINAILTLVLDTVGS